MPTVVVPVGLVMGPEYSLDGPADRPPDYWEVHLGDGTEQLELEQFMAWAAAFETPQKHAGLEVTYDSLDKLLREGGHSLERLHEFDEGSSRPITDPGATLSWLLEQGMLLQFDPLEDALDDVFGRLALFPQGQALGSTPEEPAKYRIGYAGQALAQISKNVYQLWSYSFTLPTLWDACCYLAGATTTLESDDPRYERADAHAREVGCAIPLLVSSGCAFLDPVTVARG